MGDLVGEHPVLAELEDRVARVVAELLHRVEDVDREAFERTVHAAEAQDRVGVARRLVEERRLAVLADLGAHVVAELHRDLAVAGLVPALAGHVELELERRFVVVEVEAGAARALERLDLTDEDAVHQRAGTLGRGRTVGGHLGRTEVALGERLVPRIEDRVLDRGPDEARVAGQLGSAGCIFFIVRSP